MNDFARSHEEQTDSFIHEIISFVEGDRIKSINLINSAPDEILTTLIIFDEYCQKNPEKTYIAFDNNNKQLVIECLINFWRSYNHDGPLNFVV